MTVFIWMISFCFEIELTQFGFYESPLQMHQFNENSVIASSIDQKIALFDKDGNLINQYDRQGIGPGELQSPVILGVKDGFLYVITNRDHLLVFDEKLSLKTDEESLDKLPISFRVVSGAYGLLGDFFLAGLGRGGKFLFEGYRVEGQKWSRQGQYFPQEYPMTSRMILALNYGFFNEFGCTINAQAINPGETVIDVYYFKWDSLKDPQALPDLSFPLVVDDQFPAWPTRPDIKAYTDAAHCCEYGIICPVLTRNPNNIKEELWWWNYYTWEGVFIKRENRVDDRLVGVPNGKKLYFIHQEERKAHLREIKEEHFKKP